MVAVRQWRFRACLGIMARASLSRQPFKSTALGILFLHHEDSATLQSNLLSIRKENPGATIATMSAGRALPGGYSLAATPKIKKLHAGSGATGADWLVCSWIQQRKERCRKWWIVEWDVFCLMPARRYYRPVWSYPFVASSVRLRHREPEWYWFREVKNLPVEYRPYAMGAVPFLYLVADEALVRICTTLISKPTVAGNSELRFATAANMCGFPACGFSPPGDKIGWANWVVLPGEKGILHPVKRPMDYAARKDLAIKQKK